MPKRSILVVSGAVLLVRLFTASRAPYPLPCASGPTVVMPCCVTIFHAGTGVGHPVDLAPPDHALPRGQHATVTSTRPCQACPGAARGSPWGDRRDAPPISPTCHPVVGVTFVPAISEICPPGEGVLCANHGAFADVAPLRRCQPGL